MIVTMFHESKQNHHQYESRKDQAQRYVVWDLKKEEGGKKIHQDIYYIRTSKTDCQENHKKGKDKQYTSQD